MGSKASQAATDPQRAFWSSAALLSTTVPAWPSPPGSRTTCTVAAKGNGARGWEASTSPSRTVIGGGQSSGLAAGPCLTFWGLSAGGKLSGRRDIVDREIGGSRDTGDCSSLRFYLCLCMARRPWNPNQQLLIKHRGESRGVKGRACRRALGERRALNAAMSSLILPRACELTACLFLTHWKNCFWTVMGTEGILKGLETPARSLSAPLAPVCLSCSCAAPPEGLGLSPSLGEEAECSCRGGSRTPPSSSFHSWPLLATSSPLGCSCLCTPYPPHVVWIHQTHSFAAFLLPPMPPGASLLYKKLGKEMGQPQGWEGKGRAGSGHHQREQAGA